MRAIEFSSRNAKSTEISKDENKRKINYLDSAAALVQSMLQQPARFLSTDFEY